MSLKVVLKKISIPVIAFLLLIGGTLQTPSSAYAACQAQAASPVTAVTGPQSGAVTLTWGQSGPITNYSLVYGYNPGNYQFGAVQLPGNGNTRQYTVASLTPGTKYYFQLWSYCEGNNNSGMQGGPATPSIEVSGTGAGQAPAMMNTTASNTTTGQ